MQINLGTIIMRLYVKNERITFKEARKYIKYIHIEHARSRIDSSLAYRLTIKILASVVPYYFKELDIKSIDTERTINILFAENKTLNVQEVWWYITRIVLENAKGKISTYLAYRYIIKALGSLKPNYLDEVVIYE